MTPATAKKKLVRREVHAALPDLSPLLSRIFGSRGISDPKELDYALKGLLPPDGLTDIDKAADLVADAVMAPKRLLILGDFDADGATSCALLVSGLRAMDCQQVSCLVPDRFQYGYGLTPEIVDVARQSSPDLIITVDNGISSVAGVAYANSLGLQVVITDHHLPGSVLPEAAAIVNPNIPGCAFPSKCLAGVGVAFYLLSSIRARLRSRGWFDNRTEPKLIDWLDLVALGTIADVVPLDHNNRILVHQGIRRIQNGQTRPGIKALFEVAGVETRFANSRDLAFAIAPRLNAAGRLQDMSVGIECLLADVNNASMLARQLDDLNTERKQIESGMREQAEEYVQRLELENQVSVGVCLYHDDWHQGVVGIIASRIKARLHRPVIAFAKSSPGELKGSARSVQGFHIRDALDAIAARNPGLVDKFGGHAMAAGLSLRPENLEKFNLEFDRQARGALDESQLELVVVSDGELDQPLDLALARTIVDAAPWGQGFPEPVFDGVFDIVEQRIVGGRHLKLVLQTGSPGSDPIDAICFNQPWLLDSHAMHCAYRIEVNRFRGRETPQLIIEEIL